MNTGRFILKLPGTLHGTFINNNPNQLNVS